MAQRGGLAELKEAYLLKRALADLYNTDILLESAQDEYVLDMAGYHLQQFVEKALKQYLTNCGVSYDDTHKLNILYGKVVDAGGISDKSFLGILPILFTWQTETRYGKSPVVIREQLLEYRKIALNYLEELFETDLEGNKPTPSKIHKGVTEAIIQDWINEAYEKVPVSSRDLYGNSKEVIAVNFYRKMLGEEGNLNSKEALEYIITLLSNK